MADVEEEEDEFEVLFEGAPDDVEAGPPQQEEPAQEEEEDEDAEEEEEPAEGATAYAYQAPLLVKDYHFMYTFTRRLLQYGVPLLFLVITALLLMLSIEPMVTFSMVLTLGVAICMVAMLFDRGDGKPGAMSVHLLALVAAWYFWLLYSFGYYSTWEHAEPPLQDLLLLEHLMYAVGHGVVLWRALTDDMAGLPLYLAWLLCLCLDILPVRENNLFLGSHAGAILRVCMLVLVYCAITYRHERFKLALLPREARPRSFLQLQYTLFVPSFALAVLFFLVHLGLLAHRAKGELRREEEARRERRRRKKEQQQTPDPAPTQAPTITSSAWATSSNSAFETMIDPE